MQEGFTIKRYTADLPMNNREPIKSTTTRFVEGYLAQEFIPNTAFLFENHFTRVSIRALLLLKQAFIFGYMQFQRDVEYLIESKNAGIVTDPAFRSITDSRIIPAARLTRYIKTYKSYKSKNPGSGYVDKSDLNTNFDLSFYLKYFEKILAHEFGILKNRSYRRFKKQYKVKLQKKEYGDAIALIEQFYNSTKIFNPQTGKPSWYTPINKKDLTTNSAHGMIPNETKKPTVTRTVTEFDTGF